MNEERKEYFREYYRQNKNRIFDNMKKHKHKYIFCETCKSNVKYFSMTKHRKTNKHINNMKLHNDDKITEAKILSILRKLIDF